KTYNTRYSLVVTDPTTNPALTGLSMGERTGSRVLQWVWSYVSIYFSESLDIVTLLSQSMPLTVAVSEKKKVTGLRFSILHHSPSLAPHHLPLSLSSVVLVFITLLIAL
ncbi:hypothetical protein LZ31DRAFT_480694, partial [Colletotrichum somersetense]